MIKKRTTCRCCLGRRLETVWRLGPTPLADAFLSEGDLDQPEYYYPLDVNFCYDCGFLQLSHVVSPNVIFDQYNYFSSTSPVFVKHFEDFAKTYIKEFEPRSVIDIGSNDGIMLSPFAKKGVSVLGIEPAFNVAEQARNNGVKTLNSFFTEEVAESVVKTFGKADLITATNVFAHVDNLEDFIRGVKRLMTENSVFMVECQYLLDQINKNQLGLVYHEHLSYWSVRTLNHFFSRHGMHIFRVEEIDTHSGSIRVYVTLGKSDREIETPRSEAHLANVQTYLDFNEKILTARSQLINLLSGLKKKGNTICAYGAAAKCMTPLNFFSIGLETLDYIVDDAPQKQGKFTPGKHLPVVSAEYMYKHRPDYVLLTAWNFADAIRGKHPDFNYIIPIPEPKIL